MTATVEARTVETGPLDIRGDEYAELAVEYADWPAAFRQALLALAFEPFGAGECAACDGPVGYRLSGAADETTTWLWTTLVQVGIGKVELLCEDCAQVLIAVGIE